MVTSLLSLAMKKFVKKDLAVTREITLTGRILPIGGVKEKTIAARRSNIKTIIFPSVNRRDFDELALNVKEGLDVHFVDHYNQIFDLAFGDEQPIKEKVKSLKIIEPVLYHVIYIYYHSYFLNTVEARVAAHQSSTHHHIHTD